MNATTVTRSSASLVGVDVAKSVFQLASPRVCVPITGFESPITG